MSYMKHYVDYNPYTIPALAKNYKKITRFGYNKNTTTTKTKPDPNYNIGSHYTSSCMVYNTGRDYGGCTTSSALGTGLRN